MAERGQPPKSETAFRTIGELSIELGVPQHVLRYWESRFTQLRPIQRAGKRRYYRPDDVALARRIHRLLTVEGYTVRGVQQLLGRGAGAPEDAPAAQEPAPAPAPPPAPPPGGLSASDRSALERVRDMLAVAMAED